MEIDKQATPTNREDLIKEINRNLASTRGMIRKSYRHAGVTLLVVAPTLWFTLEFIRTHMSSLASMAYLFALSGILVHMIISALAGSRYLRIVIKRVPSWMGQSMISVALLVSGISFGVFATVIGLVGQWRILTMPLFFMCYFFTLMCVIPYVKTALGKNAIDWESVKKAINTTPKSAMKKIASPVVLSACFLLALVDLFYERSELLSFSDAQGMLLLLASMGLIYWFIIAVSISILLTLYEDEVAGMLSKASAESAVGLKRVRKAYMELTRNGPRSRKKVVRRK